MGRGRGKVSAGRGTAGAKPHSLTTNLGLLRVLVGKRRDLLLVGLVPSFGIRKGGHLSPNETKLFAGN